MWIAVSVIIGVAVIGMFFLVQANNANGVDPNDLDITIDNSEIDLENEWVKGSMGAKHLIVEYSDFQCPACASRYQMLDSLVKEFSGQVALVYRHYPLPQHANARPAAQAAEAAGMQGKFYEMHDKIFDNQALWQGMGQSKAREEFLKYAEEIGIEDLEKFEADMNSDETEQAVEEDYVSGVVLGVSSTPTVFFDGDLVSGQSHEAFREIIRQAIQNDNTNESTE